MYMKKISLTTGDALIITDVQNDMLPGGRLAVQMGDAVIPTLNRYIKLFRPKNLPVIASRDWHPEDHCSFKPQGGEWPPHCVAETVGAAIASDLELPDTATTLSKSTRSDQHAYSCFEDTGLDEQLQQRHIKRLFVGGLATDYGVMATVMDGLKRGYQVCFLEDAIRAINLNRLDGIRAERKMYAKGAIPVTLEQFQ